MIKICIAIFSCLAIFFPAKHALHMFQQNRYELTRYTEWLKSFRFELADNIASLFFIIPFLPSGNIRVIFLSILLLCMAYLYYISEKKKNYIKPLVITARVKRQFMIYVPLLLLCIILLSPIWFIPLCIVILPWLMIYPLGFITEPIEANIRKSYQNEAKEILESHRDLIKVGITGSYGKTTTKNIIQAVLSEQFNSLMTPASDNTPNGITITIRELLKPIHQVFICEMGADKVGDITELVELVHPNIGVVTSIGPQHLQTFLSQENITKEKMQMIERLEEGGIGVINMDNEFIQSYSIHNKNAKIVSYGIQNEKADYRAKDIRYTQNGSEFTVVYKDEQIPMGTKLLGELNILNILSAVAVARELNIPWETIQRAVKTMKQVEHRLELKIINRRRFIDDAFNSNPVGSAMALNVLEMMPNKRFIVTPGMIDLGPKQE
ncbi:MAG: UDP-N-acetylmuramoyl-tripeptide--D-alanyl-D-alanine ligase, partial [Solobacterium sp.]|nr:UDP-N-acetylmuramoyl-tripeptide--D-alanyl-D-alanine ligase [Solobacterium sp.]